MNLQEHIRKVLKETTKEIIWLKRRIQSPEIQEDLYDTIIDTLERVPVCNFKTSDQYFDTVMETCITNFVNHWDELYYTEDSLPIDDLIYEFIYNVYGDKIRMAYDNRICD